jgi:hypothetical protein
MFKAQGFIPGQDKNKNKQTTTTTTNRGVVGIPVFRML